MNKTVEILNIEICMLDKLIGELESLKKEYKEVYDATDRMLGKNSKEFKLEDLLLANDKIKQQMLNILASRDALQKRIIKELGDIYPDTKTDI